MPNPKGNSKADTLMIAALVLMLQNDNADDFFAYWEDVTGRSVN